MIVLAIALGAHAGFAAEGATLDVPIYFDATEPWARPMVRFEAFGRSFRMLLDTGAGNHLLGAKAATAARVERGASRVVAVDYMGHAIAASRVEGTGARIPGWGPLDEDALEVSEFIDRSDGRDPARRTIDGLLSPQRLGAGDLAVVLDLRHGRLLRVPWAVALERVRAMPSRLGEGRIVDGDFKMVVDAVVAGRAMRLALDTGAPSSLVYVPRGLDLPDGAVRQHSRALHVRAGEVSEGASFTLAEPAAGYAAPFDGLLGVDVLRSCVLAFDLDCFVVGCDVPPVRAGVTFDGTHALPTGERLTTLAMRFAPHRALAAEPADASFLAALGAPSPHRRKPAVQFEQGGPFLRPTADGGYDFAEDGLRVRIHRDGSYEVLADRGRRDIVLRGDDRTALQRFRDDTADTRAALVAGNERRLMQESLEWLPTHLAALWHSPRYSIVEKRRRLFEDWDDAAEADDTLRAWAGVRARRTIERFVRTNLPAGGPDAFAADELARLNAHRAQPPYFAPYSPERPAEAPRADRP